MIPLPIILVEFLLAFGAALFIANVTAIVRLRRDGNWPPYRPVGVSDEGLAALSRSASRERPIPSARRIYVGLVIGLGVSLWAIATLVESGLG